MHENDDQSGVPGYVSIKEAAVLLGLSPSRVYEYVEDGRLSSVRAAHVILIPVEDIKNFKPNIAGRPRKSVLRWRISPENNMLFSTSITVQMRASQSQGRLVETLNQIRQGEQFLFPGTVARFIVKSETTPGKVEILLIWRSAIAPEVPEREKALEEFKKAFTDIFDWNTAQYDEGIILMHT